jgi:hypothetical protein
MMQPTTSLQSSCTRLALSIVLACVTVALAGGTAYAHKASDSYLKIRGGESQLGLQWHISIKDLELIIGVDSNRDGNVTWGELKAKQDEIVAHALSHLKFSTDGQQCKLQLLQMLFTEHSDGGYAVLELGTGAAGSAEQVGVEYSFLFEADPTHRGLVLYENAGVSATYVLSPEKSTIEFSPGDASLWHTFIDYTREGVWHIWIGFDHILFLISLLLPAVLIRHHKHWQPVDELMPALQTVLKIVTVFTIAHSITLWLAVMEYVTLPSQWVEAAIAFSIIVSAVNNLLPILKFRGWVIAFLFGLIHGFGFANVLLDLGLSSVTLGISLFGFNIGVELGQLAIVIVFLPIAFLIRKSKFYEIVILKIGSILIALVALIWVIERVGNFEILGI